MDAIPIDKRYTYADYLTWDDNQRCELIDGVVYMMSSPSQRHQAISMELSYQFSSFLRGKPCKVFHAPFDVRLNINTKDDTVVQPDLLVVCDESKLNGKCCIGAPDLAIEIISPSTARKDMLIKFNHYLQAGVREYWVVDPERNMLTVYILENGKYVTNLYGEDDTAPVQVLEGCTIVLANVFGV